MKTFKLILTNLILVFVLVILTGSNVYAEGTIYANVKVNRDSIGNIVNFVLQIGKDENGVQKYLSIEELEDYDIQLFNPDIEEDNSSIDFEISSGKIRYNSNELNASEVTYDSGTTSFIISGPKESIFDNFMEYIEIGLEDSFGNYEAITCPLGSQSYPEVSFKVVPTFTAPRKYMLIVEGANYGALGTIDIFNQNTPHEEKFTSEGKLKELDVKNYAYGKTYKVIECITGHEYGTFTIPDIKSIDIERIEEETENVDIRIIKTSGNGTKSVMTIQEMQELGFVTLYAENKSTNKSYTFSFDKGSFNNNAGGKLIDNSIIRLPDVGVYDYTIKGFADTDIYRDGTDYKYGVDFSDVYLIREQFNYILYFPTPLPELEKLNAGNVFNIEITDMANNRIPDKIVDSDWTTDNGVGHEQKYGNDTPLYMYDKIKVHFTCKETNLNETIELDVPPLCEFEDITARITAPGKISFYDLEGNEVKIREISYGLKAFYPRELIIELCYEEGKKYIEAPDPELIDWYSSDFDLSFITKLNRYKDVYEELIGASCSKIYSYYKDVVESGEDKKISVILYNANDRSKKYKIDVDKPQDTGLKYPWLEKISGLGSTELEELVKECNALVNSNIQLVTNELIVRSDEGVKDFKIAKGVYYIFEENGNSKYRVSSMIADRFDMSLAKAGILNGETKNNGNLGDYIVYNHNPDGVDTITTSLDYDEANTYPLLDDVVYRIYNESKSDEDLIIKFIPVDVNCNTDNNNLVEIYDYGADEEPIIQTGKAEGIEIGFIFTESFFPSLSKLIAAFIRTLANGLNYLVQLSLRAVSGESMTTTVDIDSILFNNYPDTSIAFFKSNEGGESPSKLIGAFRNGVNQWYDVFSGIAIAGYLIILLYIGIRILLSVGGEKQAKYKELLSNWIVGIIILVLFPYVIKYAIDINNIFVEMIENSKTTVLKVANTNSKIDLSGFSLPTIADAEADEEHRKIFASQMDKNPFADGDNSYMAVMSKKAHKSGEIVDAVVYLIMVWQFIMIVIMYYKRVFTVAFLIAIFPFVMLSYAIDKIADGKAQAFSTWTREIMVNIFVQSMHAIVYVFVIGATYVDGEYSGDWLLSIIGITFLFKGEEILKKLISQSGSTTVSSLGKTAARAVLTIKAAQKVTKNVSDNFVGSNSHLGRTINIYRQYKTEKKIARNMDFLGKPAYRPPTGNTLNTYNRDDASAPGYDELADDIQVLNNMGQYNDTERIAKALQNVISNRNSSNTGIQHLMSGLNLSKDQLFELGKLQDSAMKQYQNGDKSTDEKRAELKASINSNMQARLRIILPELNEPVDTTRSKPLTPNNQRKADILSAAMFTMIRDNTDKKKKHKKRNSDYASVEAEYIGTERKIKKAYNKDVIARKGINNVFSEEAKKSKITGRTERKRNDILDVYYGTDYENATKEQIKMAESIAIACNFMELSDESVTDTQMLTAEQYIDAVTYVAEHQNDSVENKNAVSSNYKVDTGESISAEDMVSIVAEEITRTYTDVSSEASGDHRRAIMNGAEAEIPTPLTGNGIQKELAVRSMQSAFNKARKIVKEEEEEYGTRLYFDSSKDNFEGKDVIARDHHNGYDIDTYAGYMATIREEQNEREIIDMEDFAREMIEDLPTYANEPTYEGLTASEHEQYSEDLRKKFVEELVRTGTTTLGATLGAPVGAGLAIGLSDDESALKEGLAGAAIGVLGGDQIAEKAIGKEISQGGKSKKVKILNPYTNEIEEFELKKDGITKDSTLIDLINSGEVLRYDDPRLDQDSYNLNKQFIEHKNEKMRKIEAEMRREMIDEALRNSRDRDGRV